MAKLAIVAIKTVPGKREEYLEGSRPSCVTAKPGTSKFEILVAQEEADTVMLYEIWRPHRSCPHPCASFPIALLIPPLRVLRSDT